MKDDSMIRQKLYDAQTRVLCYEWYKEPWPRDTRDCYRVWKMGEGYTKKGRKHQEYTKNVNQFHSKMVRLDKALNTQRKLKKNRRPGEYEVPFFDSNPHSNNNDGK